MVRCPRFAIWLLVLAAVCASPRASLAQGNPLIARGETEYGELRFQEALQTLSAALVRSGNSRSEQATIYRLLAFTYLALRREEEASGAYRSMLPLDPDFVIGDDIAPRIREFFAGVRERWEQDGRPGTGPPLPVEIRHRSPPEAEREQPVELEAEVQDPAHRVARLVLAYRQGTDAVFTREDAEPGSGNYTATIPGGAVLPPLVEYYFEALDEGGLPIAARGDVAAPLRIAVPEPGGINVLEQWWFWTIIGVVVAGGIVAAILIADAVQSGGANTGTLVISVD